MVDPDAEIRRSAGELGRAMSLFTRMMDRTDRSAAKSLQGFARQGDQCWELMHQIEKRNLTRIKGAEVTDPGEVELDRLKGVRRFSESHQESS